MNTIYIDTLLCVNLFIDYLLIYTVKKILRINSGNLRIIMGALTGAILTFAVFLPFYNVVFSLLYRFISAFLICFISFGKQNMKRMIFRTITYMGVSLCFSGIITLIWLIAKPDGVVIYNDNVYFDISPVMLILCTLIAFISLSIYERVKDKIKPRMQIHNVEIITDNNKYKFESMVDTGCNLREPFSGLPVIIAEKELFKNEVFETQNLRVVPYSTINGNSMLYAFKPSETFIDGTLLKSGCYLAICDGKLRNETKSLMGTNISEVV